MNINLTVIGQSLTFIVFVLFCMKYVWPALVSVMAAREQRIADGLQAAEKADKDLELAKKKAVEQLKTAKAQAAEIIEQANKRALRIVEDAKTSAEEEAQRIKTGAQADVDRQVNQAREALREKVVVLALSGAEKVLGETIDHKSHNTMLSKLAEAL